MKSESQYLEKWDGLSGWNTMKDGSGVDFLSPTLFFELVDS
jgi:hypothetical protein